MRFASVIWIALLFGAIGCQSNDPRQAKSSPEMQEVALEVKIDSNRTAITFIIHNYSRQPFLYSDFTLDLCATQKTETGEWEVITDAGETIDRAAILPEYLEWSMPGQDKIIKKSWVSDKKPRKGAEIKAFLKGMAEAARTDESNIQLWERDQPFFLSKDIESPIIYCP